MVKKLMSLLLCAALLLPLTPRVSAAIDGTRDDLYKKYGGPSLNTSDLFKREDSNKSSSSGKIDGSREDLYKKYGVDPSSSTKSSAKSAKNTPPLDSIVPSVVLLGTYPEGIATGYDYDQTGNKQETLGIVDTYIEALESYGYSLTKSEKSGKFAYRYWLKCSDSSIQSFKYEGRTCQMAIKAVVREDWDDINGIMVYYSPSVDFSGGDSSSTGGSDVKVGGSIQLEGPRRKERADYNTYEWKILSGSSCATLTDSTLRTCTLKAQKPGTVKLQVEHSYTEKGSDVLTGLPRTIHKSKKEVFTIQIS